jgi:ABC-2 type transport system permease protein
MKRPHRPGLLLVAAREWRWLMRDRVARLLIFVVPLLAFTILVAVFSHPVMRGLRTVVIDDDRSQTSRNLIEVLAASPNLRIAERAEDLVSAARALRSGDAIAAVHIPANFERDLKAQRRPQVVAFYNQEQLTAAGVASQGLHDVLLTAAQSVAPANGSGPTAPRIGTLAVENIVLVNPERNYAQFLLRSLLPMVLHVVIAISAGYAVGSEFRRRNMRAWLACAGGNPIVAIVGKLMPLFVVFAVMMMVVALIIEGFFGIAFRGDVAMMVAAAALFIIGYLALGALLQLLTRNLLTGLSATGLIVSPAYGFAGVGFPVLGMNAFSQMYGALLPLRWYESILFGQAARGIPVAASAVAFAALAGLAVVYFVLALYRLNAIRTGLHRDRSEVEVPSVDPMRRGIAANVTAEWRRVLVNRGAFGLLVLAPVFYGVFYPQPYLTEILRDVPIAVVDNDLNGFSREIVEALDASGSVKVAVRTDTLEEARRSLNRGKVFAIVGIPPDTQRDVLKGNTVPLPVYVDATYLFLYKSAATGIADAIGSVVSGLAAAGARTDGSLAKAALASTSPADILLQPIFNPVGGYAGYVVPAAFVLIVQQTLLIGAAMLTGPALSAAGAWPLATVLGRALAHLTLAIPALLLYLIVLPRIYGLPALGQSGELFVLAVPFVLATSLLGQAVGARFRNAETAVLLFLGLSIPLFFLVGFAWPREAMPGPVLAAGSIFPSEFAIDGLVRVNQTGASLHEVSRDWGGLWCLTGVYFVLAVLSARFQRRAAHG